MVIAGISVTVTIIGLEVGHRIGRQIEYDAGMLGGSVLAALGLPITAGLF